MITLHLALLGKDDIAKYEFVNINQMIKFVDKTLYQRISRVYLVTQDNNDNIFICLSYIQMQKYISSMTIHSLGDYYIQEYEIYADALKVAYDQFETHEFSGNK